MHAVTPAPLVSGPPRIDPDYLITLCECSPHCRALGLRPNPRSVEGLSLIMEARPFFRMAPGRDVWHPGAIGSALDNVLSMGAMAMIAPDSRPATVDLRWDLFRDAPLRDIVLTATTAQLTPQVVYVQGVMAEADTGAVFGRADASVAYAPPQGSGRYEVKAEPQAHSDAADLAAWLGLVQGEESASIVGHRLELTGQPNLPFWHGGALIAAMTAAACAEAERVATGARLMSATASFDIFATDLPLQLDAADSRSTRTRASVYVACSQAGRGVTSRLAAHFIRPRD